MATQQVNGPAGTMYSQNPYYDSSEPVELPDCMYKMASIHGNAIQSSPKGAGDSSLPPEVAELEKRQEAILQRLSALKTQVEQLAAGSATVSSGAAVRASSSSKDQALPVDGVIEDLVISANPASPPLSLLILKELLGQQYRILGRCHVHSSAGQVGEKLRTVFGNGITCNRGTYQLAFTVIWKDVKNGPSLMVSPKLQSAIVGEGSIARYLARLCNPSYDTDVVTATEIDNFVDMAYPLTSGSSKEKAVVLKSLNAKLGKADWLVGSQLSLADIVLWSALQQSGQAEGVSANIKKWLGRCNEQAAFQSSLQLLLQC